MFNSRFGNFKKTINNQETWQSWFLFKAVYQFLSIRLWRGHSILGVSVQNHNKISSAIKLLRNKGRRNFEFPDKKNFLTPCFPFTLSRVMRRRLAPLFFFFFSFLSFCVFCLLQCVPQTYAVRIFPFFLHRRTDADVRR